MTVRYIPWRIQHALPPSPSPFAIEFAAKIPKMYFPLPCLLYRILLHGHLCSLNSDYRLSMSTKLVQ